MNKREHTHIRAIAPPSHWQWSKVKDIYTAPKIVRCFSLSLLVPLSISAPKLHKSSKVTHKFSFEFHLQCVAIFLFRLLSFCLLISLSVCVCCWLLMWKMCVGCCYLAWLYYCLVRSTRIDRIRSQHHSQSFSTRCCYTNVRAPSQIIESISNQVKYLRGTSIRTIHSLTYSHTHTNRSNERYETYKAKKRHEIYCKILIEKNGFDVEKRRGENPSTDISFLCMISDYFRIVSFCTSFAFSVSLICRFCCVFSFFICIFYLLDMHKPVQSPLTDLLTHLFDMLISNWIQITTLGYTNSQFFFSSWIHSNVLNHLSSHRKFRQLPTKW